MKCQCQTQSANAVAKRSNSDKKTDDERPLHVSRRGAKERDQIRRRLCRYLLEVEPFGDGLTELFLALLFLLLEERSVAALLVVNTALGLVAALPATGTLVLALTDWDGGVPVTYRTVALLEKDVGWDLVGLDVLVDLSESPVGERIDLDHSGVVDFDNVEISALATLRPAAASKDSGYLELGVGALSWLDLRDVVVELVVGFPKLVAVLLGEVLGGLGALWLVDVDCQVRVPPLYPVDQVKSLLEVVEGVEENKVNVWLDRTFELGDHIVDGKSSKTEGGGLIQARKRCNAPFENVWRKSACCQAVFVLRKYVPCGSSFDSCWLMNLRCGREK